MIPVILLLVFGMFSFSPTKANAQTYTVKTGATFVSNNPPVQNITTTKNETFASNLTKNNNNNALTANAVFASNGFMPSNLFEWFLLFLVILAIVLLTRTLIAKNNKDKPLKHA